MHWLAILGLVVVLVGIAALTGLKPSGAKSVSSTRMMTAARVVLVILAIVLVWVVWNAYGG